MLGGSIRRSNVFTQYRMLETGDENSHGPCGPGFCLCSLTFQCRSCSVVSLQKTLYQHWTRNWTGNRYTPLIWPPYICEQNDLHLQLSTTVTYTCSLFMVCIVYNYHRISPSLTVEFLYYEACKTYHYSTWSVSPSTILCIRERTTTLYRIYFVLVSFSCTCVTCGWCFPVLILLSRTWGKKTYNTQNVSQPI